MNRLICAIFTIALLLSMSSTLSSQTFDDFKKQIREEYNTFEKETQQKFDDFVTQIDKEFADYLINGFGTYSMERKSSKSIPNPEIIPEAEDIETTGDIIDIEIHKPQTTYQGLAVPGIKKNESNNFDTKRINVDFLGWPLYFDVDSDFFSYNPIEPSAVGISNMWESFSKLNYNHFLYQISEVANILNLNQWGYYQLIKECTEQIYPSDSNMQVLSQWVLLSRSRYKAKIGFNNSQVFLLIPSIYNLYETDFIVINGANYYVLNGNGNTIETYENDFPESDIIMNVCINKPFNTNPINKARDYNFKYKGKKYSVKLKYDEEMIRFYNTIPLSDIDIYFNSVVSKLTEKSVKEAFTPILSGKSEVESVNILLSFAQQAFGYKSDIYAYGTEKYLFADEVLHYTFSDCEDRSVIFSYLVKTLLNKEIVAISFPGHMATAINFSEDVEGAHFIHDDKTFVIADPTFSGAPAGILLSTVINEKGIVHLPEVKHHNHDKQLIIWEKIRNYGGFKSDRLRDVVFDEDGNVYICGYITKNADFEGLTTDTEYDGRDVFIAKFNDNNELLWVNTANGPGNDMGTSLVLHKDNIYLYGSFEDKLIFNDVELTANEAPDVFVASYTTNGDFNWSQKAGIDKIDHSLNFMFVAKFNGKGEKIMAKLHSQDEDFENYGINIDENGNAVIVGSFFATPGINTHDFTMYNTGADLNIPEALYETDLKLREDQYEATIAGLFSALNLLKANSIEIYGSEIKKAFDTYNSNFISYASGIYDNLSKMKFVKNEKGIITIKTSEEKPVLLDKIKINNNARIRIVKYKSGNILVEVLSGIHVGGGSYWLDMNSIKLFKETGDLLFNFDSDNSVKKLNLKSEMLKKS
jgi:hypothetical protein